MYEGTDYIRLVKQAQLGDRDSMDRLAEIARQRLRQHVYRITLHANLTQDIVQESMLEMFKVLGKLKNADRFWPWLYGIAFNKIRHHNRRQSRKNTISMSSLDYEGFAGDNQDGLAKVIKLSYEDAAPAAMIGASNHFEVAIATAVMLFGLSSGAALATVVGVLIEVPVMLMLVGICKRTTGWFDH